MSIRAYKSLVRKRALKQAHLFAGGKLAMSGLMAVILSITRGDVNNLTKKSVLIDLGIVAGSYAVVALFAFVYHWWRTPAIIDAEKQAQIDFAEELIGKSGSLQ